MERSIEALLKTVVVFKTRKRFAKVVWSSKIFVRKEKSVVQ